MIRFFDLRCGEGGGKSNVVACPLFYHNEFLMFLKKNKVLLMGMMFGAIAGYAYYHFVGCNGSCMIASSPWISTIYGGMLGGLFVNAFSRQKPKEA